MIRIIKDRLKRIITIQTEITIAIVLISASSIVFIGIFYYHNLKSIFQEKTETFSRQIVEQVGDRIDFELAQIDRVMDILISYAITNTITSESDTIKTDYYTLMRSERMITNIKHTDSSISGIFMLGEGNILFSATGGTNRELLFSKPWIKELFTREAERKIISTHNADYMYINLLEYDLPVISIVQKINRYDDDKAGIDIIQLDLKYSYLEDVFRVLNKEDKNTIFIVDENNRIVYHPDSNLIGHPLSVTEFEQEKQQQVISVRHTLKNAPWSIIGLVSTPDIAREYNLIKKASFAIILMSVVASVLISLYLSKRITKPLSLMVNKMKEVSMGNFSGFHVPTRNVDLQILIQGFDTMVGKINLLLEEEVKQKTEIVRTELNVLKSQINSHFLYNSLEVIRGIALDNDVKSIAEISYSLSKLFRYSINKSDELVSLKQEFDIMKGYVRIHEYRYVDRFKVNYHIDEKILDFRMVRFIIQPLIENAIQHGVEGIVEKGLIDITAMREENKIIIIVEDNGSGIDAEKLEIINEALRTGKYKYEGMVSSGTGVGILNVNSRIKLYYGSRYGVELKSELNSGTIVIVTLPVIV